MNKKYPHILFLTLVTFIFSFSCLRAQTVFKLEKTNLLFANSFTTPKDSTPKKISVVNVTITGSSDTVCQGTNDTLTASGATNYVWTNNSATTATIIVTPTVTTIYTVTGISGAANGTQTFTVTVLPLPNISISGNNNVCAGQSTTLTASGGITYKWSTGSVNNPITVTPPPNMYTVIGTDKQGCSAAFTYNVNILPAPTVSASASIKTLCAGATTNSSVSLSANGTPAGGGYTWQPGNIPGTPITVSPTTTTQYTVTYTNACGIATDTVSIFVSPTPTLSITVSVPQGGCVPLCEQFRGFSNIPISSWVWSFGYNTDIANTQDPTYCYTQAGVYTVNLSAVSTGGCGGTSLNVGLITADSLPTANYVYAPAPVSILAPTVSFTSTSIKGSGNLSYLSWTFGDNTDSIGSSVTTTHTYLDTGTFCPTLYITDVHGCKDSITQCLYVNPIYTFYIPNAFTPNGSGENTAFIPKGSGFKTFEMYIYDRWGTQIYHTTNILDGWNGSLNNKGSKVFSEDVYVYKITVLDYKKEEHTYTGRVTLLK